MEKTVEPSSKWFIRYSFILLLSFLSSCAPSIHRMGYVVPNASTQSKCNVATMFNATLDHTKMEIMGVVTVRGSTSEDFCTKKEVLNELRKEACYASANLINVTAQRKTQGSNSCVLLTAQLIKTGTNYVPLQENLDNIEHEENIPLITQETLEEADRKSDGHTAGWVIGGLLICVAVGVLAGLATAQQ